MTTFATAVRASWSCAGDRLFGDDAAVVGGLAQLDGRTVMVIGNQKGRSTRENVARRFGMPRPEVSEGPRLMATPTPLPVITLIDGADPRPGEERGQAFAIAENLEARPSAHPLRVIIGEGAAGPGPGLADGC